MGSTAWVLVGNTGFEPVTFSTSRRHSPAELIARVYFRCFQYTKKSAVWQAFALCFTSTGAFVVSIG